MVVHSIFKYLDAACVTTSSNTNETLYSDSFHHFKLRKTQIVCSLSFKKIVSILIKKRIKSIQSLWLIRLIVFSSFLPWACTIKLFTAAINKARLFLTISHFHASLIFAHKARNLDLTWRAQLRNQRKLVCL